METQSNITDLPEKKIRNYDKKIFKTLGFNWKSRYIFAEYWNASQRKISSHLPYVPVLQEPFYKLEIKYERPSI